MVKRDINKQEYDQGTKLKLDIFRECFRQWYPVFINDQFVNDLHIYDLFAGSGKDLAGNSGSPLIFLEELKGEERRWCTYLNEHQNKNVVFTLNDADKTKLYELRDNVEQTITTCKVSCPLPKCPFKIDFRNDTFVNLIGEANIRHLLRNKNVAKFILLDQYGFKEITPSIFSMLIKSPKTDFIFFIASSFVKRFFKTSAVKNHFANKGLNFDQSRMRDCHRIICEYYKSLIPHEKKYYMHHFTIKKGPNYYGLIFGTSHSLGMEKFIKVCWKEDYLAGESNFNINHDFERDTLFYNEATEKKQKVSEEIRSNVLSGNIKNNREGLEFTLMRGCEPKLFAMVLESLLKEKKVAIDGKFNRAATNIHNVKVYNIRIL